MKRITIDHYQKLSIVQDIICECPCDSDDIVFDRDTRTVTIPFEREMHEERILARQGVLLNHWVCPVKRLLLTVHHVVDCTINDACQIGRIDLATLEYDNDKMRLTLSSSFPFRFELSVSAIELTIEDRDIVIRSRHLRLLRWLS